MESQYLYYRPLLHTPIHTISILLVVYTYTCVPRVPYRGVSLRHSHCTYTFVACCVCVCVHIPNVSVKLYVYSTTHQGGNNYNYHTIYMYSQFHYRYRTFYTVAVHRVCRLNFIFQFGNNKVSNACV